MSKEEILKRLADFIVDGDEDGAKEAAEEAMSAGIDPIEAIKGGVVTGLNVVGEKYQAKTYFYPDLICGADATMVALSIIRPHIKKGTTGFKGKFVLGTVAGDLHDIGKGLVAAMLEANGFEVFDLGVDNPVSKFIEAAKKYNADIVGASATLSGGVKMEMKKIADALVAAGIKDKIGYMIGGVITDDKFAATIGADARGEDCVEAVKKAVEVMEKVKNKRGK